MRLGLIADDFTRINLELEDGLEVVNLTPITFLPELLRGVDLLLIESAWLGIKNSWKGKIVKTEKQDYWLSTLLKLARLARVKTVFWNKEDPANFQRFKHLAEYFDVVLTTEESLLPHYKKLIRPGAVLACQPFFFQPKLHNTEPTNQAIDSNSVIFCGGLYKNEFSDRFNRINMAVEALKEVSVVVYDRFSEGCSSWQGSQYSNVTRKSAFKYIDSKVYYQNGLAHLNVNSIDGSRTMFSRRMLELVACGSKVIDLTKNKNKSLLSDFVIQAGSQKEVITALEMDVPNIDFSYLENNYSVRNFVNTLKLYR